MVAFGSNYDGCLGLGEEHNNSLLPVPVPAFSGMLVTSISCGDAHVMATTDKGDLLVILIAKYGEGMGWTVHSYLIICK